MSNILSKASPRPRKTTTLEIEEWGGSVTIRALPAGCALTDGTTREKSVEAVLRCVLGEDGMPFFQNAAEIEDIDVGVFTKITNAIAEISGNKTAEEVLKNSTASVN